MAVRRESKPRPNDDLTRFQGGRAPDPRGDEVPAEEVPEPDPRLQLHYGDHGAVHAVIALELLSCTIPARALRSTAYVGWAERHPGEAALSDDIHAALGPFLSAMPEVCTLMVEYLFMPQGAAPESLRLRLLIECVAPDSAQATQRVLAARTQLELCLKVLSDWYVFAPVAFNAPDRLSWHAPRLLLRCRGRELSDVSGRLGFVNDASLGAGVQIVVPQAGPSALRHGELPSLLVGSGRCCLAAVLRAARGLESAVALRISLRRRTVGALALAALDSAALRISADAHGQQATAWANGIDRGIARSAADQLLLQPQSLELLVEADAAEPQAAPLLRVLGQEMLPDCATEVVDADGATHTAREPAGAPTRIDLRQRLAAGARLPPMLPSPAELIALNFPRHYNNPAVVFPEEGLLLGQALVGSSRIGVRMAHADRSRHMYVMGATGTGKSTLLYNLIVQDVQAGHGVMVIDPHGDLYEQLLLAVPLERKRDLLLVDPDDARFCPCLNPMDFGSGISLQAVQRVATDMLEVFASIYDMKFWAGPHFEDWFRNCMLVAAGGARAGPDEPEGSVPSLASITHVLRNQHWRAELLDRLDGVYGTHGAGLIRGFFEARLQSSGEAGFANWVPYISSMLTRFVTNETMRRLFRSARRSLDLRAAMDQRRIVLVNLAKGELGSSDCRLIGMLLTKQLFQAALSRADVPRPRRKPFWFHLDEFQNFVASDIADMLAEARKYGLCAVLANQTLSQLRQDQARGTLDAVLGNVATQLFLRVGNQDAAASGRGRGGPLFQRGDVGAAARPVCPWTCATPRRPFATLCVRDVARCVAAPAGLIGTQPAMGRRGTTAIRPGVNSQLPALIDQVQMHAADWHHKPPSASGKFC